MSENDHGVCKSMCHTYKGVMHFEPCCYWKCGVCHQNVRDFDLHAKACPGFEAEKKP